MANVIKLKNSGTANSAPTSLEVGELAINYADGILYYKDSSNAISILSSALSAQGTSSIEISTTPPASPSSGDIWFESDTGKQFIYYDSFWVEVSGSDGATGPQGTTGATGATGATGDWSNLQTLRSITGATDTPTSSDLGKLLTINTTSGAVAITINSSLGLAAGGRIDFMWVNAATSVTFSASSVTLNGTPGLNLRARYSAATLVCTASNTYVLVGDLSA